MIFGALLRVGMFGGVGGGEQDEETSSAGRRETHSGMCSDRGLHTAKELRA